MVQCMVWCMYGIVQCMKWCNVWYGAVWYGAMYDILYSIPDKLKYFRVMLNLFSKPGKLCFSVNSFFFLDKENLHSNSPGNSFTNTPSPQPNFRKPQERKVSIGSKYLQI